MIKFAIDQGHVKGYNVGCVNGYAEGTAMFNLGIYLKEELEKYDGFKAILTRNAVNENPSLEQRGKIAVDNKCDIFISLHSNAFSSDTAKGVVNFYSLKLPSSKALCDDLGKAVSELMAKDTGITYYRGSQTRAYPDTTNTDYYGVIRSSVKGTTVKASFLVEHGFHTNPEECAWLNKDENLRKLAKAEAAVFAKHYGVKLLGTSEGTVALSLQEAINIIQAKTGLEEQTISFLLCYKYADSLLIKLAQAMR